MIVPDINLLIYAYNSATKLHKPARQWWEKLMSEDEVVGIPWAVTMGFFRLMTHRRVLELPLSVDACADLVAEWYDRPNVQPLDPGPRHLEFFAASSRNSEPAAT